MAEDSPRVPPGPRVAVIGHVEWIEFAVVERVPEPGDIIHSDHSFFEPAGAGAVAAVQLAKLAGACTLYTSFGDDPDGHRSAERLRELGVRVEATFRPEPQRRCFVYLDAAGERTITTLGPRLGASGDDPLPWDELAETDAVYFTAGDRGALEAGRRANAVVATTRVLAALAVFGVPLDAVVGSGNDPNERYAVGALQPPPALAVLTDGARGGAWQSADGRSGTFPAAPLPGPRVDAYGCGDSFAAGLAFALGAGDPPERALDLAARCGAACLTGRGPYEAQLTGADVLGMSGGCPPW